MRLECGCCVVRSWRRDDLAGLVRHANNRRVWLQMRDRFPHPYTPADAEQWLRLVHEGRPGTHFAIAAADRAVGGIGLDLGSDVERFGAEVGYWLGEAHWGRGIATAALRAFTRYAFDSHALHRLFAKVYAPNRASMRVLEKAGYLREGVLRSAAVKDGVVLDQVLYSILRDEVQA